MDRLHYGHEPGTAVRAGFDTGNVADDTKRLETLKARAARCGVALLADGTPRYLVTRWGLTRELDSLGAVEAWIDRVSGRRA